MGKGYITVKQGANVDKSLNIVFLVFNLVAAVFHLVLQRPAGRGQCGNKAQLSSFFKGKRRPFIDKGIGVDTGTGIVDINFPGISILIIFEHGGIFWHFVYSLI